MHFPGQSTRTRHILGTEKSRGHGTRAIHDPRWNGYTYLPWNSRLYPPWNGRAYPPRDGRGSRSRADAGPFPAGVRIPCRLARHPV